jgi:hypothetical protein
MCLTSGGSEADVISPLSTGSHVEEIGYRPKNTLRRALESVLPSGAAIEWKQDYPDSVRVKVEGIKGWVDTAGSYWEKVYLTAFISGPAGHQRLMIVADGTLASGAGALRPPEDAYVRSMDSTAGYDLNDFTQTLVLRLRTVLSK